MLSRRLMAILDRFKLWAHGFSATEGHLDIELQSSPFLQKFVDQEIHRLAHTLQRGLCQELSNGPAVLETLIYLERIVRRLFDIAPALERLVLEVAEEEKIDLYLKADIQRVEAGFPKAKTHPGLIKRLVRPTPNADSA